jgi:hypothetical protein
VPCHTISNRSIAKHRRHGLIHMWRRQNSHLPWPIVATPTSPRSAKPWCGSWPIPSSFLVQWYPQPGSRFYYELVDWKGHLPCPRNQEEAKLRCPVSRPTRPQDGSCLIATGILTKSVEASAARFPHPTRAGLTEDSHITRQKHRDARQSETTTTQSS